MLLNKKKLLLTSFVVGLALFSMTVQAAGDPTPGGCDISGTPGDDVLVGTADGETICGFGGNDTIIGLGGNDTLIGGDGNDRLFGGDGDDLLEAGAGNDLILAGMGNDIAYGRAGNDILAGHEGNDFMTGGYGTDVLTGGEDNDTMYGEEVSAAAAGFPGGGSIGRDTINGNDGFDVAYGMFGDADFGGINGDNCSNAEIVFAPCKAGDNLANLPSGVTPPPVPVDEPPVPADDPPSDADIVVSLADGESTVRTVTVELPDPTEGEIGGDVFFLFDLSGSFGDDLSTFRTQANNIAGTLSDSFSDLRLGLGSFIDAPCRGFGRSSDFGYELNLSLPEGAGDMVTAFGDALDAAVLGNGGDNPESQLEGIRQSITGDGVVVDPGNTSCAGVADIPPSSPGYSPERLRFLVVSTDASFHTPADTSYPYPTSEEDVINLLQETSTTAFFLNSGSTDAAADRIAAATGGAVFDLSADSSEVVATIGNALSTSINDVEVRLVASEDGFVSNVSPDSASVSLVDTSSLAFDVTFSPTVATLPEDQVFNFDLVVSAGGAEIDRRTVSLTLVGTDPT